jgi:hypothetical protein
VNWRKWIYDTLVANTAFVALVPANRIISSGALTGRRDNNLFVVIRMLPMVGELAEGVAHSQTAEIWAHDQPGSYGRIDQALGLAKAALVGPVALPGAVACRWQGDSQEFADDGLGTITRNSAFRCVGTGN